MSNDIPTLDSEFSNDLKKKENLKKKQQILIILNNKNIC